MRRFDKRYSPEPLNQSSSLRETIREEFINSFQDQSILGSAVPNSLPPGTEIKPFVTDLPDSPADGDEIRFLADADNGVVWQLRYRADAPSVYRWEFIGGPPLYAEVQASEGTASAAYAALATAGPSVTLPLVGDYDVSLGAQASNSTAGAVAHMSYDIGGTGAVDADGPRSTSSGAGADIAIAYTRRKTGLTAVALTAKYKQVAGGTATFARRFISATPVRVG